MSKIQQSVAIAATPKAVFDALMNSAHHSAFTGAPAVLSAEVGGAWSAYGGAISGRNLEIVDGQRIVQSWRVASWPAGVHSLVRFEISADAAGSRVALEHSSYPEEEGTHLSDGWHQRYWTPLAAWLAAR